ncbi:MAG: hypothetical protein KAU07_03265, partial [Candidatus Andersenbacteria bacterium]|nr:hypothetical protein [Candidatus Andersenbacteria bacterium]
MEIGFEETKKRKGNPNQIDFELISLVVTNRNAFIEKGVIETCRGIKNLLGVKINKNENGSKITSITVTNCAGWWKDEKLKDEEFVEGVGE